MNLLRAKTAVFDHVGSPFHHREVNLPVPSQGDMVVAIEMCTICGSDLHTIEGRRPLGGPMVLGHEIIGRVTQIAPEGATDISGQPLSVGDRVTWSLHASCGECFWCQHRLSQKCDRLFKYGHDVVSDAYPATGGFATHCQLRKGTAVIRLPETMSGQVACPANCATATVAAAFRQADDCRGQCVLIMGAGMLGLTATAWAKEQGAEQIVVVEPNAKRASLAESFGATQIAHDLPAAKSAVDDVTEGRGADVSFDFSGHNDAVLAAIHFLRIGGQAILVGSVFPTESISISPEMIVRRWLRISGIHNYLAEDLVSAIRFLTNSADRYPFRSLVPVTYGLEEIDTAVQHANAGDAIRVAVCPAS